MQYALNLCTGMFIVLFGHAIYGFRRSGRRGRRMDASKQKEHASKEEKCKKKIQCVEHARSLLWMLRVCENRRSTSHALWRFVWMKA